MLLAMTPAALAAIDIGTNSVHLVVARVDGEHIEVLEREREMVRLGSSAGDMKEMAPAAIDRGVAALKRFRQVAEIHGAEVRAVATSAVREAVNRAEFIDRVKGEAGVDVEVISGFEEARLIHLGVLAAVPSFGDQLLVFDIGGGSTEVVVGHGADILYARSLKLGSIRLTLRYFEGDKVTAKAVEACREDIRATLAPAVRQARRLGFDLAVSSSGTAGAVFQMIAARSDGPSPRTLNNLTVTGAEIESVVKRLAKAPNAKARARTPGLDPRRADIILAGALILEQIVAEMGVEELTFSDYALREGVLLDTWRRHHGGSLHQLSDLRRRSVMHLVDLMDEDPAHSAQVARLSLQLFDVTAPRHQMGDAERELLEAAALLANVGLFVSHSGHHKHSYYVIRNSEYLTGFTDREIELIAQVARYHRKSAPRKKHPEFALLGAEDQDRVRTLAGLLRVAVGLDRNHNGAVASVRCWEDDEDRLVIGARPQGEADIELDLFSAGQRTGLLGDVLGVEVLVEADTGADIADDALVPAGAP
jgi:exopolyphosphatase / guanosine-5'-triphosphate,3'-diphosphate pyrophosphatase